MTPENFASEVMARMPYRNRMDEDESRAMRGDLVDFALGKSPSVLQDIFNKFRDEEFKRRPGIWWFKSQVNSGGSDGSVWWRECDNGHQYAHTGTGCPVCGSYGYILHKGSSMPSETILVQSSCCQCGWYKDSLSGQVRGLYGPTCKEYGTEKAGYDQICKDCKCRECCQMARMFYNSPSEYRKHFGERIDVRFMAVMEKLEAKG